VEALLRNGSWWGPLELDLFWNQAVSWAWGYEKIMLEHTEKAVRYSSERSPATIPKDLILSIIFDAGS